LSVLTESACARTEGSRQPGRPRKLAAGALVAANLLVAVLAILQDWGYYFAVLVFWWEAVIVGVYNLLRMFVAFLLGDPVGRRIGFSDVGSRIIWAIVLGGIFVVKFSGFALGVGLMALVVPGLLVEGGNADQLSAIQDGIRSIGSVVFVAVGALFVSHGVSFVVHYIGRREYRRSNALVLLFVPYARLALVFAAIMAGLMATTLYPGLARSTVFALAMIGLKLLLDLASHLHEHSRRRRASAETSEVAASGQMATSTR
jgi:hypothetical protein